MNLILITSIIALICIIITILMTNIYQNIEIENDYPYIIHTKNVASEKAKVILFGYNLYLLSKNFGSDSSIQILSGNEKNIPYLQYLANSGNSPFDITKIRFCGNINDLSKTIIFINSISPNGVSCQIPLVLKSYIPESDYDKWKDNPAYRLEVNYPISIDGNVYLDYDMCPNSNIQIIMYFRETKFEQIRLYKYLLYLLKKIKTT